MRLGQKFFGLLWPGIRSSLLVDTWLLKVVRVLNRAEKAWRRLAKAQSEVLEIILI